MIIWDRNKATDIGASSIWEVGWLERFYCMYVCMHVCVFRVSLLIQEVQVPVGKCYIKASVVDGRALV